MSATLTPEDDIHSMFSPAIQATHQSIWPRLTELDNDEELEEGVESGDDPGCGFTQPTSDKSLAAEHDIDEDSEDEEQGEDEDDEEGEDEDDEEGEDEDDEEGEDEDEEHDDDSDAETTLIISVHRFTRSPTPENDADCSPRSKRLRSRRRKEMRELKAMSLSRPPPRPTPTLEDQLAAHEKEVAARIRRYGPHPVDVWFERELRKSETPTVADPSSSWITGAPLVSMLDVDRVMMTTAVRAYRHIDNSSIFEDDITFAFEFQVRLPADSGFMCYYLTSPLFILDAWTGLAGDDSAPLWVNYRVGPAPIYWTSRLEAIELVRTCSLNRWNHQQKVVLESWCKAVTRGSFADRKFDALLYPESAAGPPPFVPSISPIVSADSPRTRYLNRRQRVVGREDSPTRHGQATLGSLLNTI